MESKAAIECLSALAHEGRLALFRLLVRAGPEGLAAGEVARRLDVPPSTLSTSLAILSRAGLATSRREGRSIIYVVGFDRMAALMSHLAEECCEGDLAVCAPLAAMLARVACCPPPTGAVP